MDNRRCIRCDDRGLVVIKSLANLHEQSLTVDAEICNCVVGQIAWERINEGSLREVSIGFNPPVMAPAQPKGE